MGKKGEPIGWCVRENSPVGHRRH